MALFGSVGLENFDGLENVEMPWGRETFESIETFEITAGFENFVGLENVIIPAGRENSEPLETFENVTGLELLDTRETGEIVGRRRP